jgi:nitrite reductase/ring-hydroxylating ferredoxin subunit
MGETISQRIVDALPFLDGIAEAIQPKVQEAVEVSGTTTRDALDGTWLELPLHPALTDVPVGSWTAALVFDGLDAATGSKAVRNAADASLAFGVLGALGAAITGLSDWRYLSGGSRRMGVVSLVLRATGRRKAGRLAFLAGYSVSGTAAHLGGELSYNYGLRVNRNVFQGSGPEDFVPVLDEKELQQDGMCRVEVDEAGILLSRSSSGEVCAISSVCGHFGGPLEQGDREGDTVVCPWHRSRFDLRSGEVIDGPAVFPQSRYETRVRDGKIEVKAAEENVQRKVR